MSTMAAGGDDRLSGLGDDLLRRVLQFVPTKEGASTSVLSRRWRPLWRSCGAVNLVACALKDDYNDRYRDEARGRFYARRDAEVAAAHKALDAAADGDGPVTKLTVRVEASCGDTVRDFLHRDTDWRVNHDVFAGVLSHRAARRVEELRIAGVDSDDGTPMHFETSKYEACPNIYGLGIFPLAVGSLPSKTLRVLEITNCSDLAPAAAPPPFFPNLESLRLRHCNMPLKNLQDIIDAAPLLAIIHLDSCLLEDDEKRHPDRDRDRGRNFRDDNSPLEQDRLLRFLRCRAAISLVLDRCSLKEEGTLEIDAPMLRRFRYRGVLRHISLTPPPPHLARAELTLTEYGHVRDRDPRAARRSFWGTVRGLSHAKQMKLRVRHLEEIATTNETRQAKLLPALRSLQRLDLQGVYTPTTGDKAAAAIENLLHCCPALRDLRISLSTSHEDANRKFQYGEDFLERKHRAEFEESVHRFKRRHIPRPTLAAENQNDINLDEVSDLPGLSGHSFECLRRCLTRVGLQFQRQTTPADCFGTKLVKFFAENAKLLQEMRIDAGNERINDHMNLKLGKWIANNSSKRRRISSSTSAANKVLQVSSLTRPNIWEELV